MAVGSPSSVGAGLVLVALATAGCVPRVAFVSNKLIREAPPHSGAVAVYGIPEAPPERPAPPDAVVVLYGFYNHFEPSQMTPQSWQSVEGIGRWQEEAARYGATVLEMYCRGEWKGGVWMGKLCTGYGYRR